ncbi:hypothetical protein NDI56_10495 [Haloarcula sp. S1CR25-12]|uniref:Winged helix-turn-helix domain-containing protein n=1 Tax=Haloarcula saliterrae TaxID=2950534 RepID=A0ABU2FDM6_9EURY|nr:hypothetical protein [Haloarcula sp. S1CR25-12]MDS0259820.1 hypothetical protein [Haloarcula sp. S1CR25-12]
MSELPGWIDNRLDRNLDNSLTQQHVVETMVSSERPFFSARQLQARIKPDVSKRTVQNRLNELQEVDIVAAETYPDSVTLYYINYQESDWPLSPEGKRALAAEAPHNRLSIGFLTVSDTAEFRGFVLTVLFLTFLLSSIVSIVILQLLQDGGRLVEPAGTVLAVGGMVVGVTAFQLLLATLLLFVGERVVQ